MRDLLINTSTMHALLWVLPAAAAWLLRRLSFPAFLATGSANKDGHGAGILAGIAIGLLLGPAIFGRVMPEHHRHMFVGSEVELEKLGELRSRQQADLMVAERARVDEAAMTELRQRHKESLAAQQAELRRQQLAHQRPLRTYTYVFIALVLVSAGAGAMKPAVALAHRRSIRRAAASVGWWAALVPGGLAYAFAFWWLDLSVDASLMVAAACAIGPWTLTVIDLTAADRAEIGGGAMMQLAGRLASMLAIAAAMWVLWHQDGARNAGLGAVMLALPIGWLWPWSEKAARRWRAWARCSFIPTLAACIAVKIDPFSDWSIAAILVLALLSGDGRWTGAFIGAMLTGGRRAMRTMRLVLGAMAAGPNQLAITALGLHAGLIAPEIASALLLGALLVEVTANSRRTMADRLEAAEVGMNRSEE